MNKKVRISGIVITIFGLVALVMGLAFLIVGLSRQSWMLDAMRQEKISLSTLGIKGAVPGDMIDSAEKAQIAADTVRSHRHTETSWEPGDSIPLTLHT